MADATGGNTARFCVQNTICAMLSANMVYIRKIIMTTRVFSDLSTARTLNFELVVRIVFQNLICQWGADDNFVIFMVKAIYVLCLRTATSIICEVPTEISTNR